MVRRSVSRTNKNEIGTQRRDCSHTNDNGHRSGCAVSGPTDSRAHERSSAELERAGQSRGRTSLVREDGKGTGNRVRGNDGKKRQHYEQWKRETYNTSKATHAGR